MPTEPTATLRVSGDLDFTTAPAIEASLRDLVATTSGPVTVDCTDLRFTDSSGLAVLVAGWRTLQRDGRDLRLTAVPVELRRVLDITGLSEHLGVAAPA